MVVITFGKGQTVALYKIWKDHFILIFFNLKTLLTLINIKVILIKIILTLIKIAPILIKVVPILIKTVKIILI